MCLKSFQANKNSVNTKNDKSNPLVSVFKDLKFFKRSNINVQLSTLKAQEFGKLLVKVFVILYYVKKCHYIFFKSQKYCLSAVTIT